MVRNSSRATPAYAKRKHPGGNTLNTGVVTPLILGWNGFKHSGVGGVSTRVLEVCESNGCALTLQCMRSAKAEGAFCSNDRYFCDGCHVVRACAGGVLRSLPRQTGKSAAVDYEIRRGRLAS